MSSAQGEQEAELFLNFSPVIRQGSFPLRMQIPLISFAPGLRKFSDATTQVETVAYYWRNIAIALIDSD